MKTFSWIAAGEQRGSKLRDVLRFQYGLSRRQLIRLKKQPGSVLVNGQPAYLDTCLNPATASDRAGRASEPIPPQPILTSLRGCRHPGPQQACRIGQPPHQGRRGARQRPLIIGKAGEEHLARIVTRPDCTRPGPGGQDGLEPPSPEPGRSTENTWQLLRNPSASGGRDRFPPETGIPKTGVDPGGKPALTRYRTVKAGDDLALVSLELVTGRTHQIRIHMAHIGCPLVDDFIYGIREGLLGRTALHAHKLRFIHPQTQAVREYIAPLPQDFLKIAGTLK